MSESAGPSEEEQLRAMLTTVVAIFLKSDDDKASEARELATYADTVDDAAMELKCWFQERGGDDAAGGRVSPHAWPTCGRSWLARRSRWSIGSGSPIRSAQPRRPVGQGWWTFN